MKEQIPAAVEIFVLFLTSSQVDFLVQIIRGQVKKVGKFPKPCTWITV